MHPLRHAESRQMPVPAADDGVLLTARQVCAKLGGISSMTLWRWLGSETLRFPQPTARINKCNRSVKTPVQAAARSSSAGCQCQGNRSAICRAG